MERTLSGCQQFLSSGETPQAFLARPKYTAKIDRHLSVFVKAECANWDTHYQCCADDKPCKVLCGQPCAYMAMAKSIPSWRLGPWSFASVNAGQAYSRESEFVRSAEPRNGGKPIANTARSAEISHAPQLSKKAPKILQSKAGFDAVYEGTFENRMFCPAPPEMGS